MNGGVCDMALSLGKTTCQLSMKTIGSWFSLNLSYNCLDLGSPLQRTLFLRSFSWEGFGSKCPCAQIFCSFFHRTKRV